MSDLPDCWAVVVNWNGGAQNEACVENLLAEGVVPGHVVFVDNASTDGSAEAVATRFPDVTMLRQVRNTGYGEGTNLGIAHALEGGARVVCLVNNDVTFEPGALAALVAELDGDPGLGVVGPRVLYAREPGTVWAAGGTLDWTHNLSTMIGHGLPDGPAYAQPRDVDYVPGCAMCVRREVFERAGLLDARYFAYHEDLDFCLEARAEGFGVRCLGTVAALHDAHHSTGGGYNPRRKYMMGVNTVWFLRKRGRLVHWLRFVAFDVLTLPVLLLVGLFRGRARGVLAKALGTWHGLRGKRVEAELLEPGGTILW